MGKDFANSLVKGLKDSFKDFGEESVTKSPHLEKLCLIKSGVGRDNISDFTTNLIHRFLCEYTENFAQKYLKSDQCRKVSVQKVEFDFNRKIWRPKMFYLPYFKKDYVILTPKDILTQESNWINREDLIEDFVGIARSVPNDQLRYQLSEYILDALEKNGTIAKAEIQKMAAHFTEKFPEILDYFIKLKEESGKKAQLVSADRVRDVEIAFIQSVQEFAEILNDATEFYKLDQYSYQAALKRVHFFKDVVENKDGYKIFYKNGQRMTREEDVQILYRLTWFGTSFDVNREVNNGRGPVDFAISKGKRNKTHVEFKLAKNSQLKKNLENQTKIYEKAGNPQNSIIVIVHFDKSELRSVEGMLKELKIFEKENIVFVDASSDKPSASKATTVD